MGFSFLKVYYSHIKDYNLLIDTFCHLLMEPKDNYHGVGGGRSGGGGGGPGDFPQELLNFLLHTTRWLHSKVEGLLRKRKAFSLVDE